MNRSWRTITKLAHAVALGGVLLFAAHGLAAAQGQAEANGYVESTGRPQPPTKPVLDGASPDGAAPDRLGPAVPDVQIIVNEEWFDTFDSPPAFFWGGGEPVFSQDTFQFTFGGCVEVDVTDAFLEGDRFNVYDFGNLIGTTSVPNGNVGNAGGDPDAAFGDPAYSSGTFLLGPGAHDLSIEVIANPFEGGRGYIQVRSVQCPKTVSPNDQLGGQVHLPILNFQGQDDVCDSWIEVQNIGCEFAKAALITWGEPGFCPPQAAGPLKVECTGILKPGSTWNLFGAQVPTGSKGGILFKFTTEQLSELPAPLAFPPDDITADYLCESLFFGVVGDADDYRRFKKAYNEGLEFDLVPLDLARGDGVLAAEVHRTCPGDVTPGVKVTSKYNGVAGTHLGVYDDVFGGYAYYVPLAYADASGYNTIIYVQNGGLNCSSLEMWFKAQDDCLRAKICDVATLAPGETYQMDASECVGPDWQGSVWIRSSQVMGIAVDIVGRDLLMTYVGEPAEINYTLDPESATFTAGNQVAFAPLIYSEFQGWDSGIQVQNLSGVVAAKVKVYFLDRSGDIITTLVDWVCPRGSQTFFLPVIASLPGNWTGSARVESQEWFSPGDPLVRSPNIVAVATLIQYNDAARTEATEGIAYNLLPEHKIYDWQIASGTFGGLSSGVGLIAIPSLMKDIGSSGLTSELAIANVVPKPGFTDLVIYLYDQNGLLDYICQKLGSQQVEYIDLQTWGYVNQGYKGSAVISAWFWEHDVFDGGGRFLRNLVGLGAVSIERSGTRQGEDVPGDEAAGSRGIPFEQLYDEDGEPILEFCFMGPLPLCPGFPDTRPDPEACPATISASCENCPGSINDGVTLLSQAEIDLLAQCAIDDVDLTLNINHTWIGDITTFDLTSPEGTSSQMFSAICGNFDNIMTILDDDAPTPIGSVCPPLGFQRHTTQSGVGLDLFDGEDPAGTWELEILDSVGGDVGTFNDWTLDITFR